jgi:hypothetical protein
VSKLTITGRIDRTATARGDLSREVAQPNALAPAPSLNSPAKPSRLAQMLALGHLVERLIEEDRLRDLAHGARILGISRPRMTQLVNLVLLPPREQEDILMGRTITTERAVRGGRLVLDPGLPSA